MNRSWNAVGCMLALVAFSASPGQAQGPSADVQEIKVEIRGRLIVPKGPATRPPAPFVINASGLTIELDFAGPAPTAESLGGLDQRMVLVKGRLRASGQGRLICDVEGTPEAVQAMRPREQYLVGYYEEGQVEAVEALCRSLGLKVVDRYKPGKYLMVEPGEKSIPQFLDKLKAERSVRYVEKNAEYRVPEK